MAGTEVVDGVPVDDERQLATRDVVVVGIPVVVGPAPGNRIDVPKDVIFRGLWVAGRLLDFRGYVAHGVVGYRQVEPAGAVWIGAAFQLVPQEADLLPPVRNVGLVCIERQ